MRLFMSERVAKAMEKWGIQEGEVIYDLRLFALEGGEDLKGEIWEMVEYKQDAHEMFVDLMTDIRRTVTSGFCRLGCERAGGPRTRSRRPGSQAASHQPG